MSEATFVNIAFTTPLRVIHEQAPVGRQFVSVSLGNFIVKTEGGHVMYTLPVAMQIEMQVSYVDAGGNAAAVDGEVDWASSNEAIATVAVDADDSTKVIVAAGGTLGQVQITATADADLGAGVRSLITVADIEVVAGEAVAGTISPVGTPAQLPA
jgi:hypothetical protein